MGFIKFIVKDSWDKSVQLFIPGKYQTRDIYSNCLSVCAYLHINYICRRNIHNYAGSVTTNRTKVNKQEKENKRKSPKKDLHGLEIPSPQAASIL